MKKTTLILIAFISSGLLFGQAAKNVILEESTGAWCGFCPYGRTVMEQIESQYPNVISIADHVQDTYANGFTSSIDSAFNNYGYPAGYVDRTYFTADGAIALDFSVWQSHCLNELATTSPLYVTMQSTYNASTRKISVIVGANFVANATGDMRINCVLTEDSVIDANDSQHNYMGNGCSQPDNTSPWYNFPCTIPLYTQRHVARANLASSVYPFWGTAGIIPANAASGMTYYQAYSYTIPATYGPDNIVPNISHMKLVAFVSYYNTSINSRNILNANVVRLGQSAGAGVDEYSVNAVDVKQNTPNPFKDITAIQFQLNTADNISVKVYNMMGQEINTLVNTQLVPGLHTFYWAGDDNTGNYVRPGIYFYKISTPSQSVSKEMIYMGKQ
jgi:hypothetical protein